MRLPLPNLAGLLLSLAIVPAALARERGPRVEVACPSPPLPVKVGEGQVLAYELHITSFDVTPLTLARLEVFAGGDQKKPLEVVSGDALSATMLAVGSSSGGKDLQSIAPGRRVVVFLWIELPAGTSVPATLRHRMIFSSAAPAGGTGSATAESTLEDFSVPVGRGPVPVLAPPFEGGTWFAADGGNESNHRRSILAIDGKIHTPERFAVDWIKVGPNGDSLHDGPTRNENWWGYGEPIHAVADGEVTQVVDGIPENAPRVLPERVTLDNIAGNHVIVRIGPDRYVTYAHLQNGSIKVRLHDRVRRGAVLGHLGNSGNTTGPHLHLQVTDGNSVLQSEGIPFIFERFTDLGPGSTYEADKHPSIPRAHAMPGGNTVVQFTPGGRR